MAVPVKVRITSPLSTSTWTMVWSLLAEARSLPLGLENNGANDVGVPPGSSNRRERLAGLPSGHLPELDGAVRAAGRDRASVGAYGYTIHRAIMSLLREQFLAGLSVKSRNKHFRDLPLRRKNDFHQGRAGRRTSCFSRSCRPGIVS